MTYKLRIIYVVQRREALAALLEAASEQGGYVNARQALRLGLARDDIARLVQSDDLRRVRRGVFGMRHADDRREDEITAWLYFERDRLPWERNGASNAVLSNASAAALHGLGTIVPALPSVTLTAGRPPRIDDIVVHSVPLRRQDWTWLDLATVRLPVTSPSRTIVDLIIDGEETSYVRRAIDESLRRGTADDVSIVDAARHRKGPSRALEQRVESLLKRAA